jgi:hypothetical protein
LPEPGAYPINQSLLAVILMDLRTLTKLILKLLGLYFLVVSIVQAVNLFALPTVEWFFVLNIVVYFLIGAVCFWFPGVLINRVLRIQGAEFEGAVTATRLFGVGVALLGLYFAVSAMSALMFTLAGSRWFYHFTDAFGGAKGPDIGPEQFASLVTYAVQLAVGVGLWLGWRSVARFTGMEK